MDLTDCFRNIYPNLRRYAWHARGKSFRLDYSIISEIRLNQLETYKSLLGLHSDHSILKFILGNQLQKRGKGFRKFNTSLLHDTTYVEIFFLNFTKDSEDKYLTMQDRGLAWEMIKLKIRAFSVPYCVKKRPDRQAFKVNLEKDLQKLQEEIDTSSTQHNQDAYALNKKELEQIGKDEMKRHIFRTKLKCTELGEKHSNFFWH